MLDIQGVTTTFPSASGTVRAVNDVSFTIDRGEVVAVVGESGSGKSVTALSVTRLVPQPPAVIEKGSAFLDGVDILALPPAQLRKVLGKRIAMLFQNAYSALHPMRRVGDQLIETIRFHRNVSRYEADRIGRAILSDIGFADPVGLMRCYSYQVSAGDAQRAMLALALAGEPDLLIADEPTSLLDAVAQDEILIQLKEIQSRTGMAVWLITHDFGVVSRLADRVVVMYAGRAVEVGPAADLLDRPYHPYSRGLIASVPSDGGHGRLRQIPGEIPDLTALPSGCSFRPRCDKASDRCGIQLPETYPVSPERAARCWLYAEA
ncbi:ABC transporter ATP-binding protein [Kaistia sp. 32K]|nr:ABC transporter ATP-binding protein [Kaistia sp. 32K]